MNRKPGSTSKDLRSRSFGTAGRREDVKNETSIGCGVLVDLTEAILRRPIVLIGRRKWKPRPGRVYDFPIRRAVEEK